MEHASVSRSSWISWPLAFLLHGVFDEKNEEQALPVRFRNWNTRLTIKNTSPQRNFDGLRRSPSPSSKPSSGAVSDKANRASSPSKCDSGSHEGLSKNGKVEANGKPDRDHSPKRKLSGAYSSKQKTSPGLRRSSQANDNPK